VEGKGFTVARNLARSDLLVDAEGNPAAVAGVTERRGRFTVYNFEVEGTHTYYAGGGTGGGWWVHNDCKELWRAVSPEEYADLMRSGRFNPSPTGSEHKWFWGSYEDAERFRKMAPEDWNYQHIVRATIPEELLPPTNLADGRNFYAIPNEYLNYLTPGQ
jgi:hypothetical protein